MCIDRLYRDHEAGAEPPDGPQVVYISPLKALAVDIHQNLETRSSQRFCIVTSGWSGPSGNCET
ncbi:MAG: hypothetical protein WD757_05730 [Actinomycetota bacterium]